MADDIQGLIADYVADARNVPCPGPILTVKKAVGQVEIGQVIEVLATDQGAHQDLPAWAAKTLNEYVGVRPNNGYDGHFIRRRK